MSGTLKPNIDNLGKEIIPNIINYNTGWGGANALFDSENSYQNQCCFWNTPGSYIEISIPHKCNIWRNGAYVYTNLYNSLYIQKYNGTNYVDVTNKYNQNTTRIYNNQWEKTIENLDAG